MTSDDQDRLARTFYWDFFGPHAGGTAAHFHKHLLEFLERNGCAAMPTGVQVVAAGHHAVFCSPPAALASAIERSLRPRRSLTS
ncbi:MAG TPA: hypothetical protein VGI10_25810 [Polyangiaceae bacterium]